MGRHYGNTYNSGDFLKAGDLKREFTAVTIAGHRLLEFKDSETNQMKKMVGVSFKGSDKQLPLNVTNYNRLEELLGYDEDQWVGGIVTLHKTSTEFKGRPTPCIRFVSAQYAAVANEVAQQQMMAMPEQLTQQAPQMQQPQQPGPGPAPEGIAGVMEPMIPPEPARDTDGIAEGYVADQGQGQAPLEASPFDEEAEDSDIPF